MGQSSRLMADPLKAKLAASGLALFIILLFFPPLDRSGLSFSTYHKNRPNPTPHAVGKATIPNLLHLVYILPDPSADFSFEFKEYLSVYSAWHHWRPGKILFHTNAHEDSISRARNGTSGKWNHLIFNTPGLVTNPVTVPTHADNGVKIVNIEHKSDFVRVKAMQYFGGVYIDLDVYPLRDVKVLRESGFRAVAGRQSEGQVNSGTFMAARGSKLLPLFLTGMHDKYTGD
ncbi:hypothetical protein IMZ48_33435 [Candidatus Bathyarchaeota archaeon]|nr:hypothetical protein [Candidatus Bathyarchaeota archaeon]